MGEGESASAIAVALLLVGRNSHGNWVVRDPSGLRGGLFVDRVQAMKYAKSENGYRPSAVVVVSDVLELDLRHHGSAHNGSAGERRVA